MNILWFSWKDKKHPLAGGAEIIGDMLAQRLVKDGNRVIYLTASFPGAQHKEDVNGYTVIRVGGKYSVYILAAIYYIKHLRHWPDIVLEEINTMPFFTRFYCRQKKKILIFQLCREIWFHEFVYPLNLIGYLIEPVYLYLLKGMHFITESKSTKDDLIKFGHNQSSISVFPIGVSHTNLKQNSAKFPYFTLLSIGSIRSMKQTDHQLRAFEIAKKSISNLKLYVSGKPNGSYGRKVVKMINNSQYTNDITYLGYISNKKRDRLMQKAHCLLVTSVKEGWGLIVTEAGVLGTPSIVYNVDGLRDAVNYGRAGYMSCANSPEGLAKSIVKLYNNYEKINHRKIQSWHTQFTYEKSYSVFKKLLFS